MIEMYDEGAAGEPWWADGDVMLSSHAAHRDWRPRAGIARRTRPRAGPA